ncbi:hypothetical protein [Thiothrix lacustris]|uniref:hypothetical protein n=1 Tax=Thiothrix lacustris TaxID=525917 RepID=UPI0012EB47D2|nr:hypothetical protein [Thiothrix lacustris]
MKKQAKCVGNKMIDCEQSLVFYFMRSAKWVALALLVGIGVMGAALQFQRSQEVNWLFFSVCILCGLILFWIGHSLMKNECTTQQRNGTCNKAPSTIGDITIRQS